MDKHPKKLLVIITEAAIEKHLIQDAKRLGAQGYTVYDVRGGSEHATHEGAWEADRMIEIKIICSDTVATEIADYVIAQYATDYGVRLFFTDVQVLRPQNF
jgi:nitrogen regulatory protein P-II 2